MKLKTVFITLGLALAMGFGVFAGAKAGKGEVKEAKADTYSGTVHVTFSGTTNWSSDSAKIALYLWNDNGGGQGVKKDTFIGLQNMGSSKEFDFTYSGLSWEPANMIVTRQNKSASVANWDNKWNQTGDLNFSKYVWLSDAWDPTATLGAQIRSSAASPAYSTKQYLTTKGVNGDSHTEFSGLVTLAANEEFKILNDNTGHWSAYYGCPTSIDSCFSGGNKNGRNDSDGNIKCLSAGTYDFFFDIETEKVWLTRQDIVAADGFATYFLANVGCDTTGATAPSGWATCASTYAALSNDAKDYLYNAEGDSDPLADNIARCVYWYDYAVRAHPNLTKFMVNSSGVARASYEINPLSPINDGTNIAIIIVVASTLSLVALGGFFFIKRKKESK